MEKNEEKKTIRYIKENVFIHLCFSLGILIPVTDVIYEYLDNSSGLTQQLPENL